MSTSSLLNSIFGSTIGIQGNDAWKSSSRSSLSDRSNDTLQNFQYGYETDYYGGCQLSVFLGETWLNDINVILYNATQAKRPFYGYKSQKFDLVAKGTQIVEGIFAMYYTHTNYLNIAMGQYLKKNSNTSSSQITTDDMANFAQQVQNDTSVLYMLDSTDPSKLVLPSIEELNAQSATSSVSNLSFDNKAALLSEYFWGTSDNANAKPDSTVIEPDNLPPFNITMNFGSYPDDRVKNIPDEASSSHTLKIIKNVEITGHSIQVPDDSPVIEVYSFIARSIETPLTRKSLGLVKTTNGYQVS
jgi:hypothetical protein